MTAPAANRAPLLRIIALWRPHAGLLLAGAAVALASAAAGVVLMAFAGGVVAASVAGTALAAPLLLRAAGPARVVLRYAERMVSHAATFRALADLRVWFFCGLARHSAGGLGFARTGDLLSRLVADIESLDGLYLRIALPAIAALAIVPAAAALAGGARPLAGVAVALALGVAAFALPVLAGIGAEAAGARLTEAGGALRVAVLDAFAGLREVRAYGAEPRMAGAVAAAETGLVAAQGRLARRVALVQAAAFLFGQAALLAILLASLPPRLAVAAVFVVLAGLEVLVLLPRAGLAGGIAAAAARRVLAAADGPPAVPDPVAPVPAPARGALRFEAVHFAWSPEAPPVFAGLTLEIPDGARVALLGPSGSGKSTLAALALRVVVPDEGRITFGGTDLAAIAAPDLHRRFAWLSQTTHLFDDTIRGNLLLGRPAADEAALWAALDRAAIGDWIRGLPDKLDTWLGEHGARVSGGQGRRIALARTLLSEAPVLILDEPGAGLDAETERALLATVFAESAGRTVILIAHRLTGAERLDRIWRLSGGMALAAAA